MADKCPTCGAEDILTFQMGAKVSNFLTSLTLGGIHGERAGTTLQQVACAKCHTTYLKEVKA